MTPPRFELTLDPKCHRCGRLRWLSELDEAKVTAKGDAVVVVRTTEPCPQCGDDRVTLRPRVRME